MTYPKQSSTIDNLMKETLSAFDQHVEQSTRSMEKLWEAAKDNLRSVIMREYSSVFPKTDWNLSHARTTGTLVRIDKLTRSVLEGFFAAFEDAFRRQKAEMYRESMYRYVWVLDQVTPDSVTVRIPHTKHVHEAAVVYTNASAAWRERVGAWLGSYHAALQNNIVLGALNNSTVQDAANEVDATKAGTPSYDIFDALERILEVEMQISAMGAEDDLFVANSEDLGLVEVWKTRYGSDVCDDCDANEGLTPEEAYGDIPLHPNCRCFWRMVPASFRELLLQGDPDSRALAYDMDARGLVPDSLVTRDEEGNIIGKTIVAFEKWMKDMPQMVGMN